MSDEQTARLLTGLFPPEPNYSGCPCRKCWAAHCDAVDLPILRRQRFIMCAVCGNKRCPHATDHDLLCTGSNEPGQKGSIYE